MKKFVYSMLLLMFATFSTRAVVKERKMKIDFSKATAVPNEAISADDFISTFVVDESVEFIESVKKAVNCYSSDKGAVRIGTSSSKKGEIVLKFSTQYQVIPTKVEVEASLYSSSVKGNITVSYSTEDAESPYADYIGESMGLEIPANLKTALVYTPTEDAPIKGKVVCMRINSLVRSYIKSVTVYYNEDEVETKSVTDIADITENGTYKIDTELAGVVEKDGILYVRSQDISKSQPSVEAYLGEYKGEIGKTSYEDNDLNKFIQYDWIAIENVASMKIDAGYNIKRGFIANYDGEKLIPISGFEPDGEANTVEPIMYRAENMLHGQFRNYEADDYPAFYVLPKTHEVADFVGFIESKNGKNYMYSVGDFGKYKGNGVELVGEVDMDAIGNNSVLFKGNCRERC